MNREIYIDPAREIDRRARRQRAFNRGDYDGAIAVIAFAVLLAVSVTLCHVAGVL